MEPGRLLGPYQILSLIGAGGMGEVYRARDTRLEREVALKVLPEMLPADPEALERFVFEAKATGQLNHPNILAVFDIDLTERPYLVTEFLEGETLHDRVVAGPIPPRKAAAIGIQIAFGLDAAHRRGIIHRDLKPENIFLTGNGQVKILDFGLAKLLRSEETTRAQARIWPGTEPIDLSKTATAGSAGYMSPEQVRGRPADERSDIFSLGAVLYEMLAQRSAFPGHSGLERMNAILRDDPAEMAERVRGVSPVLERIVRRCLEKDPEERFQSARDVAFALKAWSGAGADASEPGAEIHRGTGIGLSSNAPCYQRLTHRGGSVLHARFTVEGRAVIYSATWDGDECRLFATGSDGSGTRPVEVARGLSRSGLDLFAVSAEGTLALAEDPLVRGFRRRARLLRWAPGQDSPQSVCDDAEAADWSPDGLRLAVVRSQGSGTRLEFPLGESLHESPGWVSHPRFSGDGELIAFIDHPDPDSDQGVVVVTDLLGTKAPLTGAFHGIRGLAWSADGKEILFTARSDGDGAGLHAVALSGKVRLILRLPTAIELHDISREGSVLLTLDSRRAQVSAVAPGSGKESDLSPAHRSFLCDLSAGGRFALMRCARDPARDAGGERASERPDEDGEIWIRALDGSPAVCLGGGMPLCISPDGERVLASRADLPGRLIVLPRGAGEPRLYTMGRIRVEAARWLPDGRRLALAAREGKAGLRIYLWNPEEAGGPHPVSDPGLGHAECVVSADAEFLVAAAPPTGESGGVLAPRRLAIHPLHGGTPRLLSGIKEDEVPIGAESGAVYVFRPGERRLRVFRCDLATGERTLLREIIPEDPCGMTGIERAFLSPVNGAVAFGSGRCLSELFLVRGLE